MGRKCWTTLAAQTCDESEQAPTKHRICVLHDREVRVLAHPGKQTHSKENCLVPTHSMT